MQSKNSFKFFLIQTTTTPSFYTVVVELPCLVRFCLTCDEVDRGRCLNCITGYSLGNQNSVCIVGGDDDDDDALNTMEIVGTYAINKDSSRAYYYTVKNELL